MIEMLFTQALGLVAPWQVKQVDFNREAGRIDFQVTFGRQPARLPGLWSGGATFP
jgi:hypothetical protein